jgi:tetratricopeptide (TPR) repeat protein
MSLPDRLRTRTGMALVLGAVALFSVLLYLPTKGYQFVWDDTSLITQNRLLAHSRPLDLFRREFWAGSPEPPEGAGPLYYRPLTVLSFWLDLKFAGPDPRHFHAVNLVLNALAAVIITLVLWELLHSGVWAAFGGFMFAAHSAHAESVAFISGRTDILLTIFVGLAAFALLRSQRKKGARWWLVVPPAFGLALMCKETALLFPVLVALAPVLTQTRYSRRYWMLAGVTAIVAAGYLWLRAQAVSVPLPAQPALPFLSRLVNIINTFGLYIRMFFWPFDHRVKFPADATFFTLTPNFIAALLFLVSIPLVSLRRRFWVSLWGYAWVILFLLPASNIVPLGPQAAERMLYLPSAGLVMLLLTLFSRLLTARQRLRQLAGAGLAMVIVLFGADSMTRSRVWQDESTLFTAMVKEAPRAPSAYANLASAVAGTYPDSAIRLYNEAIALDQGYVHSHVNIAMLLSREGDHRRAIHHLRIANELRPNSAQVLNNLGLAFLAGAQPESALSALDRALSVEPNLATVRVNRASALLSLNREAEADSELHRALALDSGLAPAWVMLSQRFENNGWPDSAAYYLSGVLTTQNPSPVQLNHLGTLLIQTGDSAHAAACYAQALNLDSTYVPALYNQAVLSAATGDSARARSFAARAYRLRPDLQPVKDIYSTLYKTP